VVVPREGIAFKTVSAGQLRVGSPVTFVRNALRLAWGSLQAIGMLRSFKPDAVFATGGYSSVPVGVAARVLRRPLVVYLPDVTPGWAVRLLSRLATVMATTSEVALAHLPRGKTRVVGYPVRGEFWTTDRAAARARLGLPADAQVVVVTGASLGAARVNEAVARAVPRIVERAHVLHITGPDKADEATAAREALPESLRDRYRIEEYFDDMAAAMHAADVVISRAGASTLGELPAAGAASILVPGEYEGWSQTPNAEFLQEAGAAVMLRNAELDRLGDTVLALLDDEPRRERMREAARTLARPHAADDLARLVMEVAA
jgi:UDP-N-acetylglucosamine--N-acetylmuramyl-(pentapeptide) pyrophosphoryl-undecaprenol N-acetylglucosamine transferase